MGIVTGVTKRIEVPGEDGAYLEIRMLSWITLEKARKERLFEITAYARSVAGVDIVRPEKAKKVPGAADEPEEAPDPLVSYDKGTLLKHGITAWSYPGDVDSEALEKSTAEWAAREILELSIPSEAATKNGSSRSTGSSATAQAS